MTESKINLPMFILDQMYRATMNKVSLPYGMFLTKVFKYFKIDLNNEIKRVPKAITDKYNEKTLKRMGYELKNNEWILKPTKKKEKESASKEKAPFRSGSAKRSLAIELEGSEINLNSFMAQMLDSMPKLHVKVDNMATRQLFVEKKM